jgi:signal transduction histidine kinase
VVQECLINIHRHSGSATASIRLSQPDGQIILEVEDEGRGISAEELSGIASGAPLGVGLRGMRERIKDFGGELEILSSGRGTKVKAIIPTETSHSSTFAAQAEAATSTNHAAGNGPSIADAIAKRASAN